MPNAQYQPPADHCYINRELSWLEFNRRVLEEAKTESHPLLERVKFLSIFVTNLDEFFMIRVSGLRKQIESGVSGEAFDGLSPEATLHQITKVLQEQIKEHSETWRNLIPLLHKNGISILNYADLNANQRQIATHYFKREVFPVLTPLAVDPGHPFPRISNLSLNLAVVFNDEAGSYSGHRQERFARIKVPPLLPRLIRVDSLRTQQTDYIGQGDPDAENMCFVWIEQVIAANIHALFPGVQIISTHTFRVTRDTDVEIQWDEASDLLSTVQSQVRDRRFGSVVRLEIDHGMPETIRRTLTDQLDLEALDVYPIQGTLNLSSVMELLKLNMPRLKDTPILPKLPSRLNRGERSIFDIIREGDLLLHHPYDSFSPVEDFIQSAATDPHVLAIKLTMYRAGSSRGDQRLPIVQSLIDAVDNGKQVAVMVELKARFDEENNIGWARALEEAGVHVVYGLPQIKVHAKVAMAVRKEADGMRRYVHLSTGNYNASTAKIYTDLGLFTCDDNIGEDATHLFNYLTGYSRHRDFNHLFVAPISLRQSMLGLIQQEIVQHHKTGNGHIIFKLNALVDPEVINTLYTASQEGVKVDLIVRGICCLCPGVLGLSENIRVISIVGRFLEHSRIYYFHNNGNEKIYLSSADMMQRNIDRRVEVAFPLLDPTVRVEVRDHVLLFALKDNVKARELNADGFYTRVQAQPNVQNFDSQREQMRLR
ncbi:MAG: polyphosphate kinase 1 [Chloroflexi bacterium]|jgi:polyphosphate kinase|nr:polyphosphate kinase 1 [Chloroflexota bacterium]